MNTILEQINSAGYSFVEFALPMLIQSCLLIAVLLLAELLMRKKVRAVVRYWLWMLVLIKLILPTTLSLPLSLGSWFGDELAGVKVNNTNTIAQPTNLPEITITETSVATDIPPAVTTVTPPQVTVPTAVKAETLPVAPPVMLTWQGITLLVWATVVLAMGLLLLQRVIFVRGLVAQAKNPTEIMKDNFRFCCRQMGLKSKVSLKVSANTASPAVCGLFRPVILVPENLAPTLGAGHLRIVLLHELAHIKRGDLWINLAQTVLQIIYFYNPLLWLANSVIRRIREQAVDEAVQVAMGAKAGQYPQTLIDVAKIAFNRPTLSLRLIGVVESKSALKGRIKRMLDRPTPKSAKLGILGLAMLIVIGCILLPMTKAAKSKKVSQNPIGMWKSVDFVREVEYFEPGEKKWTVGELYLKGLEFYKGGTTSGPWTWKKGYLWHPDDRTKARYIIKELEGKRYLFMEWMSGDVTIRKQKPWYYVMKEVRDDKKDNYAELNEGITVEEGVGFDDIVVGNTNCTGEFIKSKLGQPNNEEKSEKEGWYLDYNKKYGLDFWVNLQENTLYEIRLNKGFKGQLASGISISSTKQDVFDTYGKPIREEVAENFDERFDNRILLFRKPALINWWRKPYFAKIYYNEEGLLFWFDGDMVSQIVVSPKSNQPLGEDKKRQDINARKEQIFEKLMILKEQRKRIQKDLDAAERSLREVCDRWNIYDLEERSYPDPITERLNRLQRERDELALEMSQRFANMQNLKEKGDNTGLTEAEEHFQELKAKLETLENMLKEAEARKTDLDLARTQYKQKASIKDERLQRLNELKSQIEKYRLMYENPESFDVQMDVKENPEVSAAPRPIETKEQTKIPPEQNPLNEAVYKQLDQIVDLSGLTPDMSFERVLDELKHSVDPPLNVFVDWQNLYDNADIDQSTPIIMEPMPAVRLGTALKLLLKAVSNDFAKIDYTVDDGIICIATIESLPSKLETIIYNVSDLANNQADAVHLTQLITNTVEPDRWYNKGGEGTISAYNERLIVHQTPEIHKRIQDILQDLRKSQTGKK